MKRLEEKLLGEWEQLGRAAGCLWGVRRNASEMSVLELAGTAALLNGIYNGMETMMKQICAHAGTVPSGANWHADLLGEGARRCGFGEEMVVKMHKWLAFRHFFNHSYAIVVKPQPLQRILDQGPDVIESFRIGINGYVASRGGSPSLLPGLPNATGSGK